MNIKFAIVNAVVGSIVLNLLISVLGVVGYGPYIWMVFPSLFIFFALGAEFRKIPGIILSAACGIVWWMIVIWISSALAPTVGPDQAMGIGVTVSLVFILVIHEYLLASNKFLGTTPAVFLGFCLTSFSTSVIPSNVAQLTPFHVFGLIVYGVVLTVILMLVSFNVLSLFFGKEATIKYFAELGAKTFYLSREVHGAPPEQMRKEA